MRDTALAVLLLATATLTCLAGKPKVEHAPLPAKVLEAKTIYIQNDSGYAQAADVAYTQLKAWGKYQVVDAKEKADLILVVTVTSEQHDTTEAVSSSSYNYKTGAWTNGVSTVPTTENRNITQMRLLDAKTSDALWADRRPWSKKGATVELIQSLRERVEEQQKQPAH